MATWPVAARAQQPDRVRQIGVLMPYAESDPAAQFWFEVDPCATGANPQRSECCDVHR
jgi:hypothetical protein